MLFNTEISSEKLKECVEFRIPRRPDDIVQLAFLTEPEKAKIIAENKSWLVVAFSNTYISRHIAKELGENKTWETFIFQYGCTFEDGAFLYLENSNTKNLLIHNSLLTKNNVMEIMNCKKWENIDFSFCSITDESIPIIFNEKSWKLINLSGNKFSEQSMETLQKLDDLYRSYIFDETMSFEEKEKVIKTIYLSGICLNHRTMVPM